MKNRPILELPLSPFDRMLQLLSYLFFALVWVTVLFALYRLPDTIPTHFNFKGEVDREGSKYSLVGLGALATVIFIVISALIRKPHKLNYAVAITPENALVQYTNAARMLRWLVAAVQLIIFTLLVSTIFAVYRISFNMSYVIFPLIVAGLVIPMFVFIVKSLKK